MVDIHPFEPFVPIGATTLIVGSIPPARFCAPTKNLGHGDVDFYYGSKDNAFWGLVGSLINRQFTQQNTQAAVEERKGALMALGMGITDVVAQCKRKNGSALDKDLFDIVHNPLLDLLNEYTSINTLLYTSGFVKSHVRKIIGRSHKRSSVLRESTMPFPRAMKAVELYSPSPNALRRIGPHKRLEQYAKYFLHRTK